MLIAGSGFLVVEPTEANRIHHRNRPRTHCEDVAQNSAHASGRALERLNETRMIVRLDFEGDCKAVSDIDDARVLARPLQDVLTFGGQLFQMNTGTLVGAVFAPHDAKNAEFRESWFAPKQADNFVELRRSKLMGGDHFGCDLAHDLAV